MSNTIFTGISGVSEVSKILLDITILQDQLKPLDSQANSAVNRMLTIWEDAVEAMQNIQNLYSEAAQARKESENIIKMTREKIISIEESLLPSGSTSFFTNEFRKFHEYHQYLLKDHSDNSTIIGKINDFIFNQFRILDSCTFPPFTRSRLGHEKVLFFTYLERQPICDPRVLSGVIKWVNKREYYCNLIYREFSKKLGHFSVPKSSLLDCNDNSYKIQNRSYSLTEEQKDFIHGNFEILTHKNHLPKPKRRESYIMLSEKVSGATLIDFAKNRWIFLSQERKEKIFEKMAFLQFLDLVFGMTDRLVKPLPKSPDINSYDESDDESVNTPYALAQQESNVGNIMISFSDTSEEDFVHAIDNEISDYLVLDEASKNGYNDFFQTFLRDPVHEEIFAQEMIESILKAILPNTLYNAPEGKEGIDQLEEKIKSFREDLETFGKYSFIKGIREIKGALKLLLLSINFFSPDSPSDPSYIEVCQSISERIVIFNYLNREQSAT